MEAEYWKIQRYGLFFGEKNGRLVEATKFLETR
jgi:hypothetical protein